MSRRPTDEQLIAQLRTMGLIRAAERMRELLDAAAKEREACADLLEHGFTDDKGYHLLYAAVIRARRDNA